MSTRAATLTGPRAALRFGWMGVVGVSLALGGAFGLAHRGAAQEPLVVTAGGSEGTALVQAFLPGALTVQTGTPIEFIVGSGVPQTVTLGDGPQDVTRADWPVSGWSDLVGDSDAPVDMGPVSWVGSGFLNTGPMPVGSSATVQFDAHRAPADAPSRIPRTGQDPLALPATTGPDRHAPDRAAPLMSEAPRPAPAAPAPPPAIRGAASGTTRCLAHGP